MLDTLGLDSVWLMPCVVPHWSRGNKSIAKIVGSKMGDVDMKCLALGGSVATPAEGILQSPHGQHSAQYVFCIWRSR